MSVRLATQVALVGCALWGCAPAEQDGDPRLVEHGAVRCVEPEARLNEGPMKRPQLGADWDGQEGGERHPVQTVPAPGMGIAVEDLNGDGLYDVMLPTFGPDRLFIQVPGGGLVDQTEARWPAPLQDPTESFILADVDGDGDLDVFAGNRGAPNRLYLNDGEGFFTESVDAGLGDEPYATIGAAFGDMDLDGDLDLVVNNHAVDEYANFDGPVDGGDPNQLFENQGDGTFVDVSWRIPPEINNAYTYTGGFYDMNGDLYPDIYWTNDYGPFWVDNVQLENPGDASLPFVDVAAERGSKLALGGMGLAPGDMNGDGIIDFVLTNFGPVLMLESYDGYTWLETHHSREVNWKHEDGFYATWGTDLVDIDNDGDLDLYMASGTLMEPDGGRNNPEEQMDAVFLRAGSVFKNATEIYGWTEDVGNHRGTVTVDYNGDGWVDVFKRDIQGTASAWVSRCGSEAWLDVTLRGPAPNTRAIGARVSVAAGEHTETNWVLAGGRGFTKSSPTEMHFGLGQNDTVDEITVLWPDGTEERFAGVEARQKLTIYREPPAE